MRIFSLALLVSACLLAQTSTYNYGSGCGSHCTAAYFKSINDSVADPVMVYVSGGGGSSIASQCPHASGQSFTMCFDFTRWTQAGYQVYAPQYTLASTAIWPAAAQDIACFFSDAIANSRHGNWHNVTVAADSYGNLMLQVITMGPNGKYLTDGNAHCPSSNTSWAIQKYYMNSSPVDFLDATSGFCALTGKLGNCSLWFGTTTLPTSSSSNLALLQDASATSYLSTWAAKGFPRIIQLTGTLDTTVPPANQALLPAAIQNAYPNTPAFNQWILTGLQHPTDDQVFYLTGDGWPELLIDYTRMETSNCNTSSAFPSGYPRCGGVIGYAARAWDSFQPRPSNSSGGMLGGW